jgi:hypothetical protein
MEKKPKTYKPINVTIADWEEYNELAKELTDKLGFPVYVPGVIRKAVTFYKENSED